MLDRVVEPLLGGVYAGHADELSLQATVPALWQRALAVARCWRVDGRAAGRHHRAAGVRRIEGGRRPPAAGPGDPAGHAGGDGPDRDDGAGAGPVPFRLAGRLGPGAGPEQHSADALVLAVPAAAAAKLLADPVPDAGGALATIGSARVAVVSAWCRASSSTAWAPPGCWCRPSRVGW